MASVGVYKDMDPPESCTVQVHMIGRFQIKDMKELEEVGYQHNVNLYLANNKLIFHTS
jgi:hypothetical protein